MKASRKLYLRALAGAICLAAAIASPGTAAEPFAWRAASPSSVGMDSVALARMVELLAAHRTSGVLVLRHDRIACEWYSKDSGPDKPHYTASMAKALVGGLSLTLALDEGRISPDDTATKYIPEWRNDPLKKLITIRQLATHTAGIEDAETGSLTHFEQKGWKLDFWRQKPDAFSIAIYEAPVISQPGEEYNYSNPGMAALAYAVTASLKGAPRDNILDLLRERVMRPIGVPDEAWSIGYGHAVPMDDLSLYGNWGGGSYTARATASVARLLLRRGNWDGKQLIRIASVEKALAYSGMPVPDRSVDSLDPGCGLGFYTNFDGVWKNAPKDAFAGAGAGNQVFIGIPSLDLVVVRNGEMMDTTGDGGSFWRGIRDYLLDPLMAAVVKTPPPYPQSKVIGAVEFAPEDSIRRGARDSDNWPITWGDDGSQYTAYGDGWGFEPRTEKKLSNGIARITGGPLDWSGVNVRSESGETVGDGAAGEKASGMLMLKGVLYMWLRNAGNSQLCWSRDHGVTWARGFRLSTSFGCPTFLNFGPDYSGARDGYVYAYSQDGPSAYETYDEIVLARAPKDRLTERAAWEFYSGLARGGKANWTIDIGARQPVFGYPGHCYRLDIVYDPGLKCYLLALAYNGEGGWGIFEAPEPWGPWSSCFSTEDWGLGQTHDYRIPAAWIAKDGRSFYLVFSGRTHAGTVYDSFCVRRAYLRANKK